MSSPTTATMHTIKLVVIGASGVGKTSIRGQFISGGFSSGYRATIGADFIAKTLPHPTKPEHTVTLQIWDTAGQERFSSLSTAFFRGADAVILMFDVHQAETLEALKKWWAEFCVGAPLTEADYPEHPCFIVGNKIDLEGQSKTDRISLSQIRQFVRELMPFENAVEDCSSAPAQTKNSSSIHIQSQPSPTENARRKSPDWTRSSPPVTDKFNSMSSLNTTRSIYHTPSSSLFSDTFHTARSSPEPVPSLIPPSTSIPSPPEAPIIARPRRLTVNSTRSGSSGSVVTMTPSLFAREQQENAAGNSSYGTTLTTPEDGITDLPIIPGSHSLSGQPPPPPERGPSLHFTSAKTGEGVRNLFEHIAARVIRKTEYEEYFEARRMHYRDASLVETVRLGVDAQTQTGKIGNLVRSNCC